MGRFNAFQDTPPLGAFQCFSGYPAACGGVVHPTGVSITVSRKLGGDAKYYQEKEVEIKIKRSKKRKDHYLKIVEWSDEDQCYIGSIPGWIGKCCHGDNDEKVYHELCQDLKEWIQIYKEDNLPIPSSIGAKKFFGKFQIRIDSELHKALTIRALQANESLNNYCGKIIKKVVS